MRQHFFNNSWETVRGLYHPAQSIETTQAINAGGPWPTAHGRRAPKHRPTAYPNVVKHLLKPTRPRATDAVLLLLVVVVVDIVLKLLTLRLQYSPRSQDRFHYPLLL